MASPERPFLKKIFLTTPRRLDVYFYTSNLPKFLQARAVFDAFGLPLKHFRSATEPYTEEYSEGKETLLKRAIQQIADSVGKAALFFVEDTSLRIDVLSKKNRDFPGLEVKEWFGRTNFPEVDAQLKAHGNTRTATIKSDIALHVPGLERPIMFSGQTSGRIARSAPAFEESVRHPWLTPHTFNGWFIPDGAKKRLGEMSFEESWQYDFRVKSFVSLVQRVEEYTAALNLPPQAYSVIRREPDDLQLRLLPDIGPVYIVIGRTCAGKSTFGEYARDNLEFQWMEASNVVRSFAEADKRRGESMHDFAKRLMNERGADVVAQQVIQIFGEALERPLVITGFRSLEEVETISAHYPDVKVVLIDSSERTRYERHINRGRVRDINTIEKFKNMDEQQWDFGLLPVSDDIADFVVDNERTLEEFFEQIDTILVHRNLESVAGVRGGKKAAEIEQKGQLFRSLAALELEGRPLTCGEVEELTVKTGRRIRDNNVNKILKQASSLARRLELEGARVRYQLSDAGRAYLRLVRKRAASEGRVAK